MLDLYNVQPDRILPCASRRGGNDKTRVGSDAFGAQCECSSFLETPENGCHSATKDPELRQKRNPSETRQKFW